jgi:hypothetical protein
MRQIEILGGCSFRRSGMVVWENVWEEWYGTVNVWEELQVRLDYLGKLVLGRRDFMSFL